MTEEKKTIAISPPILADGVEFKLGMRVFARRQTHPGFGFFDAILNGISEVEEWGFDNIGFIETSEEDELVFKAGKWLVNSAAKEQSFLLSDKYSTPHAVVDEKIAEVQAHVEKLEIQIVGLKELSNNLKDGKFAFGQKESEAA